MRKMSVIMGVLVLRGLAVTARSRAQQPGQGVQDSVGSVAAKVVRLAPCPVLAARAPTVAPMS